MPSASMQFGLKLANYLEHMPMLQFSRYYLITELAVSSPNGNGRRRRSNGLHYYLVLVDSTSSTA